MGMVGALVCTVWGASRTFILPPPPTSLFSAQVNVCFLFTFTFTYPLVNFPMRICIHYLAVGETDATPLQHTLETVLPLCITLTGALLLTDVGIVFSLIGSIGTSSIFFLFPTSLYLTSKKVFEKPRAKLISCYAVFLFGLMVMILGVLSSLSGQET